jgi:dTMP kinase
MSAFVVVEGGEGSGKTTQVALLTSRLRAAGHAVTCTFEPGDTAFGARVREVFLASSVAIDARAELLLVAADRAQHVAEVIAPALARDEVVVCDRYSPSTLAYQGVARGLGLELVDEVCRIAEHDVVPDMVVVLDVDDAVASARMAGAGDRVEAAGDEFHAAVRSAYRELARARGWRLVDANGPVEEVAAAVWRLVEPHVTP